MNRESADRASRAVDDPEGPAVGAQACILCSKAHRVMKRSARLATLSCESTSATACQR
jgi:hypothetical protein